MLKKNQTKRINYSSLALAKSAKTLLKIERAQYGAIKQQKLPTIDVPLAIFFAAKKRLLKPHRAFHKTPKGSMRFGKTQLAITAKIPCLFRFFAPQNVTLVT